MALLRRARLRSRAERRVVEPAQPECESIAACRDRAVVTVQGELQSVTLRPVDGVLALEAELDDGTEKVTLVWLGRRRIAGISTGRTLTVHGRIGRRNHERVMFNPRYELDA